uniref:Threonyl-tRNA synthetase n=1 Tax=Sciurus vulgaris TaxID=55149 RepID=A0A8D2D1G1_SCIVU
MGSEEKLVDVVEEKQKEGGKKKNKEGSGDGGQAELNPWPEYINIHLELYNKLKAEHDSLLAEKAEKDSKPIKVTLPNGKQVNAESWKTTPYQIACGISHGKSLWWMFVLWTTNREWVLL